MKTILWAALTANGNYPQASAEHPPKPEAMADFGANAAKAGNFIVGRKTFEGFNAGGGGNGFDGIDVIVVTTGHLDIPGIHCVPSPKAALEFAAEKGHTSTVVVGGETLINAFLAEDLVDEVIFNVTPEMGGKGLNVVLPEGKHKDLSLIDHKNIGGGIVQLHYSLPH